MKATGKGVRGITDDDDSGKTLSEKIRQKISSSFRAANADLSAVFMAKFTISGSMLGANSNVPRSMDISKNGMVTIGPTIQEFYMMKVFDCSHNNLVTLPEEFAALQSLEKLDASYNKLTALPVSVSALLNLKIMLLANNSLPEVTKELCGLNELRVLDIRNNKIKNLPIEFGSMVQLYDFRALGNPFVSPSIAVFASGQNALNYSRALYSSLQSGCAKLGEFRLAAVPHEIAFSKNIETADFQNNMLVSLGEHLFDIVTLRKLNFSGNKIANVSSEISKLTNLTSANFSKNEIAHMCIEVGSISSLTELNLAENPLVTPNRATARTSAQNVANYMKRNWIAVTSQSLELTNMGILVVTEDVLMMTGLKTLNLSSNSISMFQATNFHLLVTLNLSENKFVEVPKSIGGLTALRALMISGCRCSSLPIAWKNSKMIQTLIVSRNNLTEVTEGFFNEFECLTELDISFNKNLARISNNISALTSLEILNLSGNPITSISLNFSSHPDLKQLKLISMPVIRENNIVCDFNRMTALEVLHLGGDRMNQPLKDNFASLKLLKEFGISGRIPCIPYTIASSSNLSNISILECPDMLSPSRNIIEAGPSAITKYLQIMYNSHLNNGKLNLSSMKIETAIANVQYMQHLTHADFSDNLLSKCDFFGISLTNLQSLNLSKNHLSAMSDTVSFLTALKTLLLDSNLLNSLPDTIGNCESMNYISLLNNPISSIPLSLGKCKYLQRVYVDSKPQKEVENFPNELQSQGSEFLKSYLSAHAQIYTHHSDELAFKPERYEFEAPAVGLTHVPSSILMLSKLQRLNLSLNSILKLPEELFCLFHLVELNLNFCELSIIPNMINKLTNITNLCLAGNRLVSFDVNMSSMSGIKKLWLQDNRIAKVTKTLERCLELRYIILKNNRLKTVPLKIWKLRFLAELGLDGNPELEVPPAELVAKLTVVESCAFLKAFDEAADVGVFDGANLHLKYFPRGTIRIASLTNLSIRNNQIMHIPDEISEIVNLKQFDMRQNPCRRLPPTLCTLVLIKFQCDQETMTCPPPIIISQGLQKINWFLRKLLAARLTGKVIIQDEKLNVFEYFQDDFYSIKLFDVKGARIQEIPKGISLCTSLTDLQLNENFISLISDEFCECSSLRRLSLSNNRIGQNMNPNISNLQLLSEVVFSGNYLNAIPDALFRIPNVMTVDVSNNKISGFKVPKNGWNSLTHLNLSNNALRELPVTLFDVISLRILLLKQNLIASLQEQFKFLENLTKLDLSTNMLENVEDLKSLNHLQFLDASSNKIKYISYHFGSLSDLQDLKLDENPIDFPPIEITSTGSQNTLALMRQYCEGFSSGSLDIQSFGLRSLPNQLLNMDHLLVLNARNNSILFVPKKIGNLTTLQELYLDNNRIGSIPVEIHGCSMLAILSLKGNPIIELPASICLLKQLTVMHADHENFKIPPPSIWAAGLGSVMFYLECMHTKFAALESQSEGKQSIMLIGLNMLEFSTALLRPTLMEIDVSMNKIKDLPMSMFQMPCLKILRASSNRILKIHASISKCDTLVELKIDHNEIATIPATIGYLSRLQILRLEHNCIKEIPGSFGLLLELIDLGLHANPVNRLPLEMSELSATLISLSLTSGSNWEIPTQNIIAQGKVKILEFLRELSFGISKRSINVANEDVPALYLDHQKFRSNLVQLNCSSNRIGFWPTGIFECGQLEKLNLRSNCIISIPHDISCLRYLELLDVSFNVLSTIPECLGTLTNLNTLIIEHNNVQMLPETMSSLHYLKIFNAAENKLTNLFGGFNRLIRLQVLILDLNEFAMIPEELFDLFSLEELWLAGNKISQLPEEIGMLKRLRIAQFTSNRLMSIPREISCCEALEELLISNNFISIIPTEIGLCLRLKRLEYDDCPITLPKDEIISRGSTFAREYLQYCAKGISTGIVNLSTMQLSTYPHELVIVSKTLTDLDLSQNELVDIPATIALCEALQFLDLSNNKLTSLPVGLEACFELKGLDIEGNKICSLHFEYSSLTNLVALNSTGNKIVRPNEAIIEQGAAVVVRYMSGLSQAALTRSLDLSSAGLLYVPSEITDMSFLTSLDIDDNKISDLPEELMNMRHLRELHMDGNNISSFPPTFSQLLQLQELYFAENGMTHLPKVLGKLTNLQRLSFIGNPIISPVAEVLALPTEKVLMYLRKTDALVSTLDLKNWQFTTIHLDVLNKVNLHTLNMQSNRIKQIPAEFAELVSLTSVNFEENLLSEFPKAFCELRLEILNLSKNFITAIPEFVRFMTAMLKLNLSQNRISALPNDISALVQMKILNLNSNMLTSVPDGIGELLNLRTLDLRENAIFSLPMTMYKMSALKRLKIDEHSPFTFPPKDVVKLGTIRCIDFFVMRENARQSKHLDMSLFNLSEVTVAVYQVGSTITTLDLSKNHIFLLPKEFGLMNSLISLDLSSNMLNAIPQILETIPTLEYLNIANNKAIFCIDNHVENFNSLISLNANDCSIQSVPDFLMKMSKLERLIVGVHSLTELKSLLLDCSNVGELPGEIGKKGMKGIINFVRAVADGSLIRQIDISWAGIRQWPNCLILLQQVRKLNVSHNLLVVIPESISLLVDLTFLDISTNELTALPASISACLELAVILMRHNHITSLPESMGDMLNIDQLDVDFELFESPPTSVIQEGVHAVIDYLKAVGDAVQGTHLGLSNGKLIHFPAKLGIYLTHVQSLNLEECELVDLHPAISYMLYLVEMVLDSNFVSELPHEIGELKQLQYFSANMNRLQFLPESIGECESLANFQIQHNNVTFFPISFGKLKKVRQLLVDEDKFICPPVHVWKRGVSDVMHMMKVLHRSSFNRVLRLNHLGYERLEVSQYERLSALEKLSMSKNRLSEISNEMCGFQNLVELVVNHNQLTSLPDSIYMMQHIAVLHVAWNRISKFPDCICKLKNLIELDISHNEVSKISNQIMNLNCLTYFDISYNKIESIAPELACIPNLILFKYFENAKMIMPPPSVQKMGQEDMLRMLHSIYSARSSNALVISKFNLIVLFDFEPSFGFYNMENLILLDISDNMITEIPGTIKNLKKLKSLNASKNQIQDIPDEMNNLIQLRKIDLSKNALVKFPDGFVNFTDLQDLQLSFNNIATLPFKLHSFHHLETLSMSGNRIREFPDDVSQLRFIRIISCSGCALISLPSTIGCLWNLSHLLVNKNRMTTLPGSIGSCRNLRIIDASHNNLEKIPNSLCDCPILETLNLKNNALLSLTQYLGRLTSLTILNVTNNSLINASKTLSRCCFLKTLDFSHNNLDERSLQDCITPSCTDLNFSNNEIKSVHKLNFDVCTSLKSLSFDSNAIVLFPMGACKISTLTDLRFSQNRLHSLPYNIEKLTDLQSMRLDNNRIVMIPSSISSLRLLSELHLDSNCIKMVCDEIGLCDCLQDLMLHANEIDTIPESIRNLTNLKLLTLSNNRFNAFPEVLSSLVNLKELWLQNQKTGAHIQVSQAFREEMYELQLLML